MKGLLASFVAFHGPLDWGYRTFRCQECEGMPLLFSRNFIIVRGRKPAKNIRKH